MTSTGKDHDWPLEDEWCEPLPRAFCDSYTPHESHVYGAINGCTYECSGITAANLVEMDAAASEQCEHGMQAALCAGPDHYMSYADEKAREGY